MSKKNKKRKKLNTNNDILTTPTNEIKKDESPIIFQRPKLKSALSIRKRPDLTDNQKIFLEFMRLEIQKNFIRN